MERCPYYNYCMVVSERCIENAYDASCVMFLQQTINNLRDAEREILILYTNEKAERERLEKRLQEINTNAERDGRKAGGEV